MRVKLITGFDVVATRVRDAIRREKQIKGWLRIKKLALIVANNPAWKDLSEDWYAKEKR